MYERFVQLCNEKGVKPSDVSKATGISTATLTSWKKGVYTPKEEKIRKIAEYFGVTVEYMRTGKDPEGYYENDETAEIAQAVHDNPELRLLFSAAKDADPQTLKDIHEMLLIMKRRERGDID